MGFIEPKNEKSRIDIERILAHKQEKPLRLIYAKYRNGKTIDEVWRD